ncbi:recombinase family protein [Brevibacillus laterosporus]|uniref:recombinase family protein n=1 Tax=Brevibacillus laterosporus TaxID=1465 RepID=UPI0018CFC73C|nr:recombinase family protein [Brevibacillus laterosporus]MBG9775846.1 recombinase [Brevibacillus laterosporus]MBG9796687.1 recombinase [Brevibacillus laterosporus]MCR8936686.1 recombinase family protein [Brevibacillus laterosporus]MCZ0839325.1 recombinase family protein [Brevibacillus laterosporus]MCZ0844189.1 recombinase family protein [Brevibacillus laterosporus]
MGAGVKLGYVRVSTKEQNLERQTKKMKELGVDDRFLFIDKQSGKDFDRPGYLAMKNVIREGDIIYVDALDRLGRDYDGIVSEWKEITRTLNADIIVLENASLFDSSKFKAMGDMGKLMEDQFLSLLAYVAQQERKKIKQRQAEGIAVARENGVRLGRPKLSLDTLSKEQRMKFETLYSQWKSGIITAVQFMKELDLKKTTFYKILKEYERII